MIIFKKLLIILLVFLTNISFSQNSEKDLIDLAIEETRSDNNRKAIKILNKVIRKNEKSAYAYNIRSVSKTNLGNYKSALGDLDNAIEISPNYAHAYFNKGHIKYTYLHDYIGAIEEYNKAIELDSTDNFFYNNRGLCKAKLMNHEGAIEDYDKAINLDSNIDFIYINRARSKRKLGLLLESLNDCNYAIYIDSLHSDAYYLKGFIFYDLNEIENACENFKKANELGIEDADVIFKKFCNQEIKN